MLKPRAPGRAAQKTARIVEASLKPVSERYQQKTDKEAARIAEASLKASESHLDRQNYTINYRRKRALLRKSKEDYTERKRARQRQVLYLREASKVYKDAKLARREDMALGPLAPKRDVGEFKDKFATAKDDLLHPPPIGEMDRKKEEAIVGQNRFFVHDRVVVIRGKEAGKIGTVTEVNKDSMVLSIRGFGGVGHVLVQFLCQKTNAGLGRIPTA